MRGPRGRIPLLTSRRPCSGASPLTGQHIELGIAEHNLFLLLGALGLTRRAVGRHAPPHRHALRSLRDARAGRALPRAVLGRPVRGWPPRRPGVEPVPRRRRASVGDHPGHRHRAAGHRLLGAGVREGGGVDPAGRPRARMARGEGESLYFACPRGRWIRRWRRRRPPRSAPPCSRGLPAARCAWGARLGSRGQCGVPIFATGGHGAGGAGGRARAARGGDLASVFVANQPGPPPSGAAHGAGASSRPWCPPMRRTCPSCRCSTATPMGWPSGRRSAFRRCRWAWITSASPARAGGSLSSLRHRRPAIAAAARLLRSRPPRSTPG